MPVNQPAAFYLLPFRAFELMVGSVLALPGMRFPESPKFAAIATTSGLALIAVCFLFFSGHAVPRRQRALPTLGAALVIWGSDKTANPAASALGSRPMILIGKISYSLYLVHWPLILVSIRLFPYTETWYAHWCSLQSLWRRPGFAIDLLKVHCESRSEEPPRSSGYRVPHSLF